MKTFVIEEKFVGYADITIEAETEEEAIQIYKDGNYKACNYNLDEYFYEFLFLIFCQFHNNLIHQGCTLGATVSVNRFQIGHP